VNVKSTTDEHETRMRGASQRGVVSARSALTPVNRVAGAPLLAAMIVTFATFAMTATPALAADALVLEPDFPLILGLIVGFVVLMFPANQLIFKPIFQALDERDERIQGARSRAGQIQRDADGVLSDYETRIREARADADSARKEQIAAARSEQAQVTATARSEAEARIEQARATLAGDLETAREQMRSSAQELARSAAEQILGRSLS
jgi:F-type H+-transporting ATPase subunit b